MTYRISRPLAFLCAAVLGGFVLIAAQDSAQAQNLNTTDTCTTPRANYPMAVEDPNRWNYCDIYMRRFAYRETHLELKNMMEERAKNFRASSQTSIEGYEQALRNHHASLRSE
ncbi:MAG: hypothetical protein ACK4VI_03410 [Alphaproteobacteria bacterium]